MLTWVVSLNFSEWFFSVHWFTAICNLWSVVQTYFLPFLLTIGIKLKKFVLVSSCYFFVVVFVSVYYSSALHNYTKWVQDCLASNYFFNFYAALHSTYTHAMYCCYCWLYPWTQCCPLQKNQNITYLVAITDCTHVRSATASQGQHWRTQPNMKSVIASFGLGNSRPGVRTLMIGTSKYVEHTISLIRLLNCSKYRKHNKRSIFLRPYVPLISDTYTYRHQIFLFN